MRYFDLRPHVKEHPETFLWMTVGRRGSGKTTSALLRGLDRYVEERKRLLYVRRWTTELTIDSLNLLYGSIQDRFQKHYLDLFHEAHILREEEYKWYIQARSGRHFLWAVNENDKVRCVEQITSTAAVSQAVHAKGPAYDQYDTILFDEIVSDSGYVKPAKAGESEVDYFTKIVHSVSRAHNKSLRVFMTANPDYDIDSCPYLYPYHINYETMEPWALNFYDGAVASTKKIKNNTCIIKVAKLEGDDDDYLLSGSLAMFGSAEERMADTGEVKDIKYARATQEILDEASRSLYAELIVECPIVRAGVYHAKIYSYPCTIYGEPALVVMGHHWSKAERLKLGSLFCRFDLADIRPYGESRLTYRLNIPPLPEFGDLSQHLRAVQANQFIFADTDRNGTLFTVIRDS